MKNGGKTTTFTYDANHQRAYKKGAGGATVYVGGLYEKRTDSSGKVTHVFFVPGDPRIVGQIRVDRRQQRAVNGHNAVYFHDDHLGSIESVTGPRTTATHLKYDPFGGRINPLNPTKTAKAPADITDGFTDQQHDDELGLINMQGRIYDPMVARFLSADPFAASSLTSQGFNRYSYVSNSPLGFVDPTGFRGHDPHGADHACAAGGAGGERGSPSGPLVCDGGGGARTPDEGGVPPRTAGARARLRPTPNRAWPIADGTRPPPRTPSNSTTTSQPNDG